MAVVIGGAEAAQASGPDSAPRPAAAVAQGTRPRGIYAVIGWNEEPARLTWTRPDVDGMVLRTYWRDMNPRPGVYTWDTLDRQFSMAARSGKRIHLIIAPGMYSPDWVIQYPKVRTALFYAPQGPRKEMRQPLPLPWDQRYLQLWFAFVDTVAGRYAQHPALAHISATGPNSHNGEIALPRETADERIWLELVGGDKGLLERRLIAAWTQTIDHFCKAFDHSHFTLALILKSFPVGRNAGLEEHYVETLARHGFSRCPANFGLQSNGLDGRPLNPPGALPLRQWALIERYANRLLTGFQTRSPANLYRDSRRHARGGRRRRRSLANSGARGEEPTKEQIFSQVINNGLSRRVDFPEIYERDLNDPGLTDLIQQAHRHLIDRAR